MSYGEPEGAKAYRKATSAVQATGQLYLALLARTLHVGQWHVQRHLSSAV